MRRIVVQGVRIADVADAVGPETWARGQEYARRGAVMYAAWSEEEHAVEALVRGSGKHTYATTVFFEPDGLGDLELTEGYCTCPMGAMCKHVAAAALSVVPEGSVEGGPPGGRWTGAVEALLPDASSAPAGKAAPLAVELSLDPAGVGPLHARLLRPGKRGWIVGGLAWNRIDEPRHEHDVRADHLALARELFAMVRAGMPGASRPDPYEMYGDRRTIDLAEVTSPRFWPWFDDARRRGITFLQARHELDPVTGHACGTLALDVTTDGQGGALRLGPALILDGAAAPDPDLRVVTVLGTHGLVAVSAREASAHPDPAQWPLHLVRLDPPAAPELASAARRGRHASVPAEHVDRFRERYGTRLRTAISSDGSFTPPTVSGPTLVLCLAYGEPHELAITWVWSYDVGGTESRTPVGTPDTDAHHRDPAAEQAVLDALAVLPVDRRSGVLGPHGPRAGRCRGFDTVVFTTEVVPVLEGVGGVRVERTGSPADYREVGDELRIGLSVTDDADDGPPTGTDWFDLDVTVTAAGQEVPFVALFAALAAGESHLLLPDGAYFSLEKPELAALRSLIEEARALHDGDATEGLRVSRFQAGWWEELAALGVVEQQADAWHVQVGGLLDPGALATTPVPADFGATLRPYQREGFEWLAFLLRHGLGGVLADDMGLGKTVQTLALIHHARLADPDGAPFLIVAPTSVVANWAHEARRFTPGLEVVTLTDTLRRRGQDLATAIGGADVVVTSYTLLRLDAAAHEGARWSGVVFDEAQVLKNRRSKLYGVARRVPAPFKLAVTGTPMENDLMELWSLLSITAPGLFPSPTAFAEQYARPIERRGDAELLARLRRRVRPLMTRRTKEQVSPELPPKQQQVLAVELSPAHRAVYQRHLQRERQKVLGLIDDLDRHRFTILQSITRLRQLSLHPALGVTGDDEAPGLSSSKIEVLVEQLTDVVAGGHRALVFSQFTGFLAHVRAALDAAGIAYAYLDGATTSRDRVVTGFKTGDAPVFLISLKAGGVGLNLTEADYCFLLDPWWNPATEAQAIDRTHRIGQQRPVVVYRLIARDTVEEKVRALAERKAALFAGVIDEGEVFAKALDADDIRALVA